MIALRLVSKHVGPVPALKNRSLKVGCGLIRRQQCSEKSHGFEVTKQGMGSALPDNSTAIICITDTIGILMDHDANRLPAVFASKNKSTDHFLAQILQQRAAW